ncbi:hypothetical protein TNCV_1957831 [Trichonephila clavipes]|nr:hypothetical protein TNCV_1957831 [Trichonephila clavipes]
MPISVYVTLCTEVHEQMSRSGGCSDMKLPVHSSQAQALHLFIDSLKGWNFESTLPSPGFEPRACGVKVRHATFSATVGRLWILHNPTTSIHMVWDLGNWEVTSNASGCSARDLLLAMCEGDLSHPSYNDKFL